MDCLQCKEPLLTLEQDSVEIDYCSRCRGMWLDAGELNFLLGGEEAGLAHSESIVTLEHGNRRTRTGRRCPACGRKTERGEVDIQMVTQAVRQSPGPAHGERAIRLPVERCPACLGLWLDGGSLEKLINLKNGGTIQPLLKWLHKIFNHQPAKDWD